MFLSGVARLARARASASASGALARDLRGRLRASPRVGSSEAAVPPGVSASSSSSSDAASPPSRRDGSAAPRVPSPSRGVCEAHVPTFVACGEGFAPAASLAARVEGTDWGGPPARGRPPTRDAARSSSSSPPTTTSPAASSCISTASLSSACHRVVALADAGHGVGRALLAALLDYPDCRLVVAAASPSEDLVTSLRYQHWAECEALQLDVARVDLGSDADVRRWSERVEFTHGVPDVVITNAGATPSRWKTLFVEEAERRTLNAADPSAKTPTTSATAPHKIEAHHQHRRDDVLRTPPSNASNDLRTNASGSSSPFWRTPAADFNRMLNDVKGVANVVRHFAPGMLDRRTRGVPGSRGDFAAVVNVTHVLDPPEAARNAAYRASRAAIGALTASLARELADANADRDRVSGTLADERAFAEETPGGEKTRNHEDREHFHPGGNDVGGGGAVESSRSNSNANARRDRSASANSRVIAIELDPGAMPGLVWPSEGADVGPTHAAKGDAAARDWARAAVPFILGLTPEVTGASLHVPGFPPG